MVKNKIYAVRRGHNKGATVASFDNLEQARERAVHKCDYERCPMHVVVIETQDICSYRPETRVVEIIDA